MRPVAVFRHFRTEGPGYFAIFLERHGIPWRIIAIDEEETVPVDPQAFSGLCFMGGPMNASDPLPWIERVCSLIRNAADAGIPVVGHCLGGQLISKALGGTVTRNPVPEIGWGPVRAEDDAIARHWLGAWAGQEVAVFHWHKQTFSIPPGASRLLTSATCVNQAFALGPHLGLQCHVEMLPEMIRRWCKAWNKETSGLDPLPPSIQTPEMMEAELATRLPQMRRLADQLYGVWIKGLRNPG
ncbi:MAG: glutamine amidotransferase [Betaproteobacteria bacterium ADurb.Bin341]|nr:MAG: glutamine amidotransferase [Betaproteobacteria bacterium ADurb.Bin341]